MRCLPDRKRAFSGALCSCACHTCGQRMGSQHTYGRRTCCGTAPMQHLWFQPLLDIQAGARSEAQLRLLQVRSWSRPALHLCTWALNF